MEFDLNQLRELLTILNQTDVDELCLKSSDFELTIRKSGQSVVPVVTSGAPAGDSTVGPAAIAPDASAPAVDEKWVEVISPMVGTFYRSPAPDEAAFVEVGDRIRQGQTLCIIEAMKLMNELEAELNGEIMEILVENGEPIEYGQTLMWINPSK